jgi:uncharacterized protein (TIRG00374 family)
MSLGHAALGANVARMNRVRMKLVILFWRRYRVFAWVAFFTVLIGLFIVRSRNELTGAFPLISRANTSWILVALAAQIVTLFFVAVKYRLILQQLGATLSVARLARIQLRRHFISSIVPFGGPAGMVSFTRDLGRDGVPAPASLCAIGLITIVNEIAFALYLTPVLIWLAIANRATRALVIGEISLLAAFAAIAAGTAIIVRNPGLRSAVHHRLPERLRTALGHISFKDLRPRDLIRAVPCALAVNACGVAMLTCSLWAVGAHPSFSTILAARSIASLTMLLIPTWQGAGAVELTVTGALIAGGVPAPAAIAAVALFRIAQLWFPLLLGAGSFASIHPRYQTMALRGAGLLGALMVVAVLV